MSTVMERSIPVVGRRTQWVLETATFGGTTAGLASGGALATVGIDATVLAFLGSYPVVAAALGVVSGAVLGAVAPTVLDGLRKRIALKWITLLAIAVGAVWGALVAGLATLVLAPPFYSSALFGAALGAPVGAVTVGLLWLPYTMQMVLGGRRWPVLMTAALLAPILGILSFSFWV